MDAKKLVEKLREETSHIIQEKLYEILEKNNLAKDGKLEDQHVNLMNGVLDLFYRQSKSKSFYLFGRDAVSIFSDEGTDAVIDAYEDNEINYQTYCYDSDESTECDLLFNAMGWNDFCIITEEEYNKLN